MIGEILLRDLIFEDTEKPLDQIMTKDPISVLATMDDEDVAALLQEYDLLAIPVVDNEHRLIGVVTVDDAMDVLKKNASIKLPDKAGLIELSRRGNRRSRLLTSWITCGCLENSYSVLGHYAAWRFVRWNHFEGFESALAMVQLAFFIPMIMAMGGNVGTQSSTIFTRALVLGQINVKQFMSHLFVN